MIKKITFILIFCIVCFSINITAATKADILSFVDSQGVCGDVGLFNSYKSTFTRLLNQKDLTSNQLDTIYGYLQNAVGILNSKGVCRLADLSKLKPNEKSSVYNYVYGAAGIITSAPTVGYGQVDTTELPNGQSSKGSNASTSVSNSNDANNNSHDSDSNSYGTKVTIDTANNTMDIYENGVLIDKVTLGAPKMTYTGRNPFKITIAIVLAIIFIVFFIIWRKLSKVHKRKIRCVKNVCISLMMCSIALCAIDFVAFDGFEKIVQLSSIVSFKNSDEKLDVIIDERNNILRYPSYGTNYADIVIPSVNISSKVYYGDTPSLLSLGVGHTTTANMPTENGVVIYSGHNKESVFGNLKNIVIGDEIVVDTNYAKCTYTVEKTEILKDTQIDKLVKLGDKETLIMYTCYPFDSYVYTNNRFVVYSTIKSIEYKVGDKDAN